MYRILATVGVFHQAIREIESVPQMSGQTFFRVWKTPVIADHVLGHAPTYSIPVMTSRAFPPPTPPPCQPIHRQSCHQNQLLFLRLGLCCGGEPRASWSCSVEQCSSSLDSPFVSPASSQAADPVPHLGIDRRNRTPGNQLVNKLCSESESWQKPEAIASHRRGVDTHFVDGQYVLFQALCAVGDLGRFEHGTHSDQ